MDWSAIGAVAEGIGALGVLVTLVYISAQVKHNTRAVEAATYDSIVEQFRDWNAPFRQDAELVNRLTDAFEDWGSVDPQYQRQMIHIFYDLFKLSENVHYQYRQGMMEDDLWRGWEALYGAYLLSPGAQWYWQKRRHFFADSFGEWMDSLPDSSAPKGRGVQLLDDRRTEGDHRGDLSGS